MTRTKGRGEPASAGTRAPSRFGIPARAEARAILAATYSVSSCCATGIRATAIRMEAIIPAPDPSGFSFSARRTQHPSGLFGSNRSKE